LGTAKGAEYKKENNNCYAQQALSQELQESGKKWILVRQKIHQKAGKEKGYAYIYGTGDAASILYAEDKFDITKEIIKALNDKYKAPAKTEEKVEAKNNFLY
jgi:outer membrane protein